MVRNKDKSETVVTIAGKSYTLMGYESDEYMQRVASFVNSKLEEYRKVDSYRRLPADTQNVLVLLNIADEFFKTREQVDQLNEDLERRDKDLYDVKHNLVTEMSKNEALEETMKEMRDEINEKEKRIVQLETELSHSQGAKPAHQHQANQHQSSQHPNGRRN
ncbi:MAG: cell division protein ZapA [Lachnospiraceae bacterium]|nr:cell division protein ZapA [Lachnospiraceae bacterium]MCR5410345.1 cell division protein ZapA [Lachnospiraceae bacterium]